MHVGGFGCSAMETQKNTAFNVLSEIIGGDNDSILFDELREERGLAYSTEFDFDAIRQMGYFVAGAIVDRREARRTVSLILEILQSIKVNGIKAEDLQKPKIISVVSDCRTRKACWLRLRCSAYWMCWDWGMIIISNGMSD